VRKAASRVRRHASRRLDDRVRRKRLLGRLRRRLRDDGPARRRRQRSPRVGWQSARHGHM